MTDVAILGALVLVGGVFLLLRLGSLESRLARLSRLEAKVDALLKHSGVRYDPLAGVPAGVQDALQRGQTIEAIKLLRQATGLGLKDAKDQIDELRRRRTGV